MSEEDLKFQRIAKLMILLSQHQGEELNLSFENDYFIPLSNIELTLDNSIILLDNKTLPYSSQIKLPFAVNDSNIIGVSSNTELIKKYVYTVELKYDLVVLKEISDTIPKLSFELPLLCDGDRQTFSKIYDYKILSKELEGMNYNVNATDIINDLRKRLKFVIDFNRYSIYDVPNHYFIDLPDIGFFAVTHY